jgi:hypothetical protein
MSYDSNEASTGIRVCLQLMLDSCILHLQKLLILVLTKEKAFGPSAKN